MLYGSEKTMKIKINNATVVTMDPENTILRNADVLIEEDRIVSIQEGNGRKEREKSLTPGGEDRTIAASGMILMPGLINCHSHVAMSLFRNYGNDVNLQTWLEKYIFPLEAKLTAEEVRAGTRLNLMEMLLTGTTSFVDMYFFMEEVAKTVQEFGMRALLTRGMSIGDEETQLREMRELYEHWNGSAQDRIRVMIGPHAVYTNSIDFLKKQKELGDALGCGFHIHVSETEKENRECLARYGKSPAELFDSLGMLDERSLLAHGVALSEKDMDLIARRGSTVVHNPSSNMKLASGVMPLEKMRQKGVRLALGTDGASSNNRQDMFREMLLASFLAKVTTGNPEHASVRTILRMATIDGARALGRESEIGSVEIGKKADLILVDFQNAHHTPFPEDIEAALVYSTSAEDVFMTMVDGRILAYDHHLTFADEEEIREGAQEQWEILHSRGQTK